MTRGRPLRMADQLIHNLGGVKIIVLDATTCSHLQAWAVRELRVRARDRDLQLYEVMKAIWDLADEMSSLGRKLAPKPDTTASSGSDKPTVSTTQAAEILGIDDRSVRRAIDENRLAATKPDGIRWRITLDELDRYKSPT